MKTLPIETRLLGLTTAQYAQLKDQARREAAQLRREAIEAAWQALARRLQGPVDAVRRGGASAPLSAA